MITREAQVKKRDGRVVGFEPERISGAIANAFRAERGLERGAELDPGLAAEVGGVTEAVIARIPDSGDPVSVEQIQDLVEEQLMRDGHYRVARRYILYREEHKRARMFRGEPAEERTGLTVRREDGSEEVFEAWRVRRRVEEACRGLEGVDVQMVLDEVLASVYDGISPRQVEQATILAARSHIEKEPAYSTVAARLLLGRVYRESWGTVPALGHFETAYREGFEEYLRKGVEAERLDPGLLEFDLGRVCAALVPSRDDEFTYLGLQTIYDRYLIQVDGRRVECPQYLWMRVGMGLALKEDDREQRAIEFYDTLSTYRVVSATPTLFNSGTLHPQLSSCYLTTVSDDLEGIFKGISDNAKLSKWAGGLGNDWTRIRATGSLIKGTSGESQGVIPFLKIVNDTAVAVNQSFVRGTPTVTADGVKAVEDVGEGDLLLTADGEWREIEGFHSYDQHNRVLGIRSARGFLPLGVTDEHPFYVLRDVPKRTGFDRINPYNKPLEWVEAKDLKDTDFIAHSIPSEFSNPLGLSHDDARFLGLMLGDGHVKKARNEAGISLHETKKAGSISFVRDYLSGRGVSYSTYRDGRCLYVTWNTNDLPWIHRDLLYDAREDTKKVHGDCLHLPPPVSLGLIIGLIESDGYVKRGRNGKSGNLVFCTSSLNLAESVRHVVKAFGVLASGHVRHYESATYTRRSGERHVVDEPGESYEITVPAFPELAEHFGVETYETKNWLRVGDHLFERVLSVEPSDYSGEVYDFVMDGHPSYSTTAALAHNGGKRKGAACAYLETWHLDIEDFLELRKNTGDERRRTHDMNTANWVPDLFMKRVIEGGEWTLFSPNEVPDLHDLYGKAFEERYLEYERMAEEGELRQHRKVEAFPLWQKMLSMLFETGHPWVNFKDPANVRSPQDHAGVVHSSNLCCVTGDQRAVTDRGIIRVRDLHEMGGENIVVGRDSFYDATPMEKTILNAPVFRITTREGYTHKVTSDHPLWVKGRGWVEAKDLREGDRVEIQQREGLWGDTNLKDEAFLCGLVAGDGTFDKEGKTVFIDLWSNGVHVKERVENAVERILEGSLVSGRDMLRTNAKDSPKFSYYESVDKWRFSSRILCRRLGELGFNRDTKLEIPEFVWRGTKETVAAYLEGLYLADATVQAGNEETVVSLASCSKQLLEEVQILWANFGVKTFINKMRDARENIMPDGKGGSRSYRVKPLYRLLITSIKGCRLAEENTNIGFHRGNAAFLEDLSKEGYSQKMYATVSGVTRLPNEDVYCLKVGSEDRAWACNGLVTKNTEITLNTSDEETAVCNLCSFNLGAHTAADGLDEEKLAQTVEIAVRMLDNVIDINFYPTPEAERANVRHRAVGLGIMGFQDALFEQRIPYASEEAIEFADRSMEMISYYAILTSSELAAERGTYPTYEGSKWDRGLLPIDTIDLLEAERGEAVDMDRSTALDWSSVRESVARSGMRNSNVMAVAPTATISNISGVYQSIEPTYSNLFVKSNLSGEFVIINPYLVADLKERGLWDEEMLEDLKYFDGSVAEIERVPEDLKKLYLTAFEIDTGWLIDCASRRQKWLDQSQSLNLYLAQPSGRLLHEMYVNAWRKGLKTTYYLRSRAATGVEKSNTDVNRRGMQPRWMKSASATGRVGAAEANGQSCSTDDEECEACQ